MTDANPSSPPTDDAAKLSKEEAVAIPVEAVPVTVSPAAGTVMLTEKYAGGLTWCLVVVCFLFVGPLGCLFLFHPCSEMADPNANVNTSNPDSNEALKMLEQYRPSEQPSPTSPGSPQAAVVAEPVESQPTKVDLATEPTVVQAVEVPVNATPVMRVVTIAVLHTKEILEQKLQPSAVPVTVNGECIEPVKSYKYLGMEFNSAGISVNSILQKLELCEIRLNKYRDFIQSREIWNATKRNLVRALVLSPGLYSLVNWPEDERINKKLHMLSRKIKAAIENIHIKEVRIQEGDLDVCKIVQDLKDKYNRTEKTLHDEQLTSLRLSNINNNLQPKRPREISYLEVQDRLNWNPTPPTEPPPEQSQQEESNLSNTPPTPNRISPIAIARTMSRYKRQRLATINPLEYIQTMLAVNESSQNP
eukprot:augustus_masked-scaffold_3-processed-gene-21.91-mRNA-1 protein AED:1.00 eAED:1.00 QI:0/0/0/0/1/1/4/0/417